MKNVLTGISIQGHCLGPGNFYAERNGILTVLRLPASRCESKAGAQDLRMTFQLCGSDNTGYSLVMTHILMTQYPRLRSLHSFIVYFQANSAYE